MVSEFILYVNGKLNTKQQVLMSITIMVLCISLIKIDKIIDKQKDKK